MSPVFLLPHAHACLDQETTEEKEMEHLMTRA